MIYLWQLHDDKVVNCKSAIFNVFLGTFSKKEIFSRKFPGVI